MKILTRHSTANDPLFKIIAAILFIVFPLIGIAIGIQYQARVDNQEFNRPVPTPTPKDEFANWKTYINKDYSFSFKHPNLISLNNTTYGGSNIPVKLILDMHRNVKDTPKEINHYQDLLRIDVFENKNKMSLKSYAKLRADSNYTIDKQSDIVIGNQIGIMQTIQHEDSKDYFIESPNGNRIFKIYRRDAFPNSFSEDFNKILSTFKFLD